MTVKNGDTGNAIMNLIPVGGFAQVVNIACTNLPSTITCKFTPAKITLDGTNPGTATLVINTKGFNSSELKKSGLWAIPSGMALAGLLILPLGRRRKLQTFVAAVALMVAAVGGIGCGSSTSDAIANAKKSNNVGTYKINVTTTSVTGTAPEDECYCSDRHEVRTNPASLRALPNGSAHFIALNVARSFDSPEYSGGNENFRQDIRWEASASAGTAGRDGSREGLD